MRAARASLAEYVHSDADNVVYVPNATTGVNTILQSLRFEPGDELLANDHEYKRAQAEGATHQQGAGIGHRGYRGQRTEGLAGAGCGTNP